MMAKPYYVTQNEFSEAKRKDEKLINILQEARQAIIILMGAYPSMPCEWKENKEYFDYVRLIKKIDETCGDIKNESD